ncbi:MAG: ABC transporter ATP-binding protein [Magnetospirillum sp.]|nr:ABC transporter ATP-binding protein [Magnetospirillum sp.]
MSALLAVENVCKSYGRLAVTQNVSFTLAGGRALGVIGPNGAGKTTLFNLISGDVRPDSGRILFKGERIDTKAPSERCRAGIGRSYQIPHPFAGMTVLENLLVGSTFGAGMSEREAIDYCVSILDDTGLLPKLNRMAGSLTLLDRKRLELARALATRPTLLLLDEIAGGLTDQEVHELVGTINEIRDRGISIIWIEHIVHALMAVVDQLIVINFGQVLQEGDPPEVMASAAVQEIYMGIDVQ